MIFSFLDHVLKFSAWPGIGIFACGAWLHFLGLPGSCNPGSCGELGDRGVTALHVGESCWLRVSVPFGGAQGSQEGVRGSGRVDGMINVLPINYTASRQRLLLPGSRILDPGSWNPAPGSRRRGELRRGRCTFLLPYHLKFTTIFFWLSRAHPAHTVNNLNTLAGRTRRRGAARMLSEANHWLGMSLFPRNYLGNGDSRVTRSSFDWLTYMWSYSRKPPIKVIKIWHSTYFDLRGIIIWII